MSRAENVEHTLASALEVIDRRGEFCLPEKFPKPGDVFYAGSKPKCRICRRFMRFTGFDLEPGDFASPHSHSIHGRGRAYQCETDGCPAGRARRYVPDHIARGEMLAD